MKAGKILLLLVAAMFGGLVLVGCMTLNGYNKAISLEEGVGAKWAQVENQLQRRYDLIPNLVETVKGFAGQEEKIFLGVAEARKAYFSAQGPAEKARAATGLEGALSRLLVLRETYPELKSNQSFLQLQDELAGTENRLAVERKRYNESVQDLNRYVRKFPGSVFASIAGVEKAEYFKPEGQALEGAPKVDFSGG